MLRTFDIFFKTATGTPPFAFQGHFAQSLTPLVNIPTIRALGERQRWPEGRAGSGTCTARVNWPLDCVCSHMPDGELSNCIRGSLRCIYDNKGSAADLDEHTWCFQQCRTGWFWWSREYALYQRLDAVIHCCAKKQGTIIGPGGGAKPGPGGPKAAQKVDCCGCGPGTQRPLDCSGY